MAQQDRRAFEDALIADMRAHEGNVTSGWFEGQPLLVLTVPGARTGEPRRSILTYSRDGGDYVVAGTAGGAPTTPAWVGNLAAHPDVSVEVENRLVPVRAEVVRDGAERDRLWRQHVDRLPWFADYETKVTSRVIPMVRLTPREE